VIEGTALGRFPAYFGTYIGSLEKLNAAAFFLLFPALMKSGMLAAADSAPINIITPPASTPFPAAWEQFKPIQVIV
jgi:hypothetical protein